MNYLAHAYLSFRNPEILAGNMISDFIKGKKKFDYPEKIQQGISLHRAIDTFTDFHQATYLAKEYFRPAYRLYSGPFTDIIYDHFLANDLHEFKDEHAIDDFAHEAYLQLTGFHNIFPERFAMMFPYMKNQNWLFHYRNMDGIRNSLEGLTRRATFIHESKTAFLIFEKHYDELRHCYNDFFPSLKKFAYDHLQLLNTN
jgi:acyl carrier protein phosphodiesterase